MPRGGSLARASLFVGGCAALSRLTGLARDMAMAWLLGGGPVADALVAAMRVPHLLRRLLAEGSLSMTLTAALVRRDRARPGAGRELARAVTLRLAVPLALLLALGWLAAPWLLDALAPGLGPEGKRVAPSLFRLCLPYADVAVMAAISMAVLHSRGAFFWPAVSPLIFNGVLLLFAAAAALGLGDAAAMLAAGLTCAGCAQWLVQALAARRVTAAPLVASPEGRREAGRHAGRAATACLRRLPPGILGAAAPQLAALAAMTLASFGTPGSVTALYYAERLMEVPLGIVGVCLGTVSLPRLSRLASEGDWPGFDARMGASLRLALLFGLAAAAGLAAVGEELVDLLLGRGAFGSDAVRACALALWGSLPGLPACAAARPLLAACAALGAWRAAAAASLWAVAVTAVAGIALIRALPPSLEAGAPALAVSAGMLAHAIFLRGAIRRRRLRMGRPWGSLFHTADAARACLAAAAAGLTAWGALACPSVPVSGGFRALSLTLACAGGACAWAAALLLLRDAAALAVWRALWRRLRENGVFSAFKKSTMR